MMHSDLLCWDYIIYMCGFELIHFDHAMAVCDSIIYSNSIWVHLAYYILLSHALPVG